MSTVPVIDPSPEQTARTFAGIVAASLRVDPDRVVPEVNLVDLGAESIDIVEITLDVENAFSIVMPERSVLDIAREVLGDDVVATDGRLTAFGAELLRRRMPEVPRDRLVEGARTADVQREFLRVGAWLRLIAGVLERSPRACPKCRGALVQGAPGQVRCEACGDVAKLPAGDDLAREWVRETAARMREGGPGE
jgi:acyl carrier protein